MRVKELSIDAQVFAAEQERRRLSQVARMIGELSFSVARLENEIAAEERRARINDPKHIAYPIYARDAALRRAKRTIGELRQRRIAQNSDAAQNFAKSALPPSAQSSTALPRPRPGGACTRWKCAAFSRRKGRTVAHRRKYS